MVNDVVGYALLGFAVEILLARCRDDTDLVLVRPEAGAFVAERVQHNEIEVFLLQLLLCVGLFIIGFQGKAYQHLSLALPASQLSGNVGVGE